MTTPGFTAETSLFKSSARYITSCSVNSTATQAVTPQLYNAYVTCLRGCWDIYSRGEEKCTTQACKDAWEDWFLDCAGGC
jgi:hypothetical protein